MLTASLAARSLRNRLLTTSLTVASIALSVTLLVGIENVRVGMRESFSQTISQTDLIVGGRGGSTQLLLSSVFGIGAPSNGVSWATYEHFRDHPAVAWTIPYSLGDSHRGFRVIGTTNDFYEHYRFREERAVGFEIGAPPVDDHGVVLGAEVARELGYAMGDAIELTHGIGPMSFVTHEEHPFEVVGVLESTFTPIDRSVYVTLEGIAAMHEGWEDGAMPGPNFEGAPVMPGAGGPPSFSPPPGGADPGVSPSRSMPGAAGPPSFSPPPAGAEPGAPAAPAAGLQSDEVAAATVTDAHEIDAITSFFVGTTSRIDALRLQREVTEYEAEPVMAVLPGVALAEMWRSVGYAEDALKIVSGFVVLVGLLGMIVSLYTSLNERRREMAILRAVGARRGRIITLLVLESGLLAVTGCVMGVALVYVLLLAGQGPIERNFGLYVPIRPLGRTELLYIGAVVIAGFVLGIIPALKAYRNALVDGLSLRV